jgi:hypothetical protein
MRKTKPRMGLWRAERVGDWRRWRREMRDFLHRFPQHGALSGAMYTGDDAARLALADAAEEEGWNFLSLFLRRYLVCALKSPLKRRRKQ